MISRIAFVSGTAFFVRKLDAAPYRINKKIQHHEKRVAIVALIKTILEKYQKVRHQPQAAHSLDQHHNRKARKVRNQHQMAQPDENYSNKILPYIPKFTQKINVLPTKNIEL